MRVASLLSIFSLASAPAAQGKSFDSVLQAAITDALQRHSGNSAADYGAQSNAPAAALLGLANAKEETPAAASDASSASDAPTATATDARATGAPASSSPLPNAPQQPAAPLADPVATPSLETSAPVVLHARQDVNSTPSTFAAVLDTQGNRASGTAIGAHPRDAGIVGQPSQPPSNSLSQGTAAASKATAPPLAQLPEAPQTQSASQPIQNDVEAPVSSPSSVAAGIATPETDASAVVAAGAAPANTHSSVAAPATDVPAFIPRAVLTQRSTEVQLSTSPASPALPSRSQSLASSVLHEIAAKAPAPVASTTPAAISPATTTSTAPAASAPMEPKNMPTVASASDIPTWSQTATSANAQPAAVGTYGRGQDDLHQAASKSTAGASARMVWPTTKLSSTVQTVLPTPFLHSVPAAEAQSASSLSVALPLIANTTPLPVAEVSALVNVPPSHDVAASSPGVQREPSFTTGSGVSQFPAPQSSAPLNSDATAAIPAPIERDTAPVVSQNAPPAPVAPSAQAASPAVSTSLQDVPASSSGDGLPARAQQPQHTAPSPADSLSQGAVAAQTAAAPAAAPVASATPIEAPQQAAQTTRVTAASSSDTSQIAAPMAPAQVRSIVAPEIDRMQIPAANPAMPSTPAAAATPLNGPIQNVQPEGLATPVPTPFVVPTSTATQNAEATIPTPLAEPATPALASVTKLDAARTTPLATPALDTIQMRVPAAAPAATPAGNTTQGAAPEGNAQIVPIPVAAPIVSNLDPTPASALQEHVTPLIATAAETDAPQIATPAGNAQTAANPAAAPASYWNQNSAFTLQAPSAPAAAASASDDVSVQAAAPVVAAPAAPAFVAAPAGDSRRITVTARFASAAPLTTVAPADNNQQATTPKAAATTTVASESAGDASAPSVRDSSHPAAAATTQAQDVSPIAVSAAPQAAKAPASSTASRIFIPTADPAPQTGVAITNTPAPVAATPLPAALPFAMALPPGTMPLIPPAQTSVAPVQRNTPRATLAGNAGASSTPASAQTKDTQDSSKNLSVASDAQNIAQPAQHSHADASPAATPASAIASAPAAIVAAHASAHTADPAARSLNTASDASPEPLSRGNSASLPQSVDDVTPASGIHAASVIQAMGGTEMRVGMHSTEFGDISIRTSVSAQQMMTQIAVDHSGLGQAISAHAASVQARFQEQYGVHSAIEVTQQGASFSGGQGGSAQREQQGFVRSLPSEAAETQDETEIGLGQLAIAGAGEGYRLDIVA